MNRVLERLCSHPGVAGAAIFHKGLCLASHGIDEASALHRFGEAVQTAGISRVVDGTHTVEFARRGDLTLLVRLEAGTRLADANVRFHVNVALRVLGIRAGSTRPPARHA